MSMIKWFFIQIGSALAAISWFQLINPDYARNFNVFQDDAYTIQGSDSIFNGISATVDQAMMGWVMIYEQGPDATESNLIWSYQTAPTADVLNQLETFDDGSIRGIYKDKNVSHAGGSGIFLTSVPRWFHLTMSVCSSGGWIKLWAAGWQGSLTCQEVRWDPLAASSPTGVAFASTDVFKLGEAMAGDAKGQILGLKFATGQWVDVADIEPLFNAANSWHALCSSNCWGPGNYSCNDIIQLIDPIREKTLTASTVYEWSGTDTFLMGRASEFSTTGMMYSGWFYHNSAVTIADYLIASNVDTTDTSVQGSTIPYVYYDTGSPFSFEYKHDRIGDVESQVTQAMHFSNMYDPSNGGIEYWVYVIAIACSNSAQIVWAISSNDNVPQCADPKTGNNFRIFDPNDVTYANIAVGKKYGNGPVGKVKDVRYYHSLCYDNLNDLDNAGTQQSPCNDYCLTCADPGTCSTCQDGYWWVDSTTCSPCWSGCSKWTGGGQYDCQECHDGWYLSGGNTCPAWATGCLTCTDGLRTSWPDCVVPYYLQPASVWCELTCPSGYYPSTSTATCAACHSGCQEWTGSSIAECQTGCNVPYYLQPSSDTSGAVSCAATCPTNYWRNATTANWVACADQIANCEACDVTGSVPLCTRCASSTYVLSEDSTTCSCPDQCVECDLYGWTKCAENEVLDNGNWSQSCSTGTYLNGSRCDSCIKNCFQCEDGESCLNCSEPFIKNNGVCECITGYFEKVGTCKKCDDTWVTCVDVPACVTCDAEAGRVLDVFDRCVLCSDIEGYDGPLTSPSGTTIGTVCHPICGDGILLGAESCDDGNIENGDGCSSICQTEDGFQCDGTEGCIDLQAPSVLLVQHKLSGNDYTLILSFSEPVLITGSLEDNVDINLSGGITAFTWSMETYSQKSYNAYELTLTVTADVPQNTDCTVSINVPIVDMSGKPLDDDTTNVTIDSKVSVSQPQLITSASAVTRAAGAAGVTAAVVGPAAGAGGASSSGASAALSFNPARFWMLVETMQILNMMAYVTLPMPELVQEFFRVLSVANCSFMPNIFEFFIEDSSLSPPVKFVEEEQATNFLLTAGDALGVVISNFAMFGLVAILALIKPTPGMHKRRSLLLYPAPLRIAIEGYLDFNIAIGLQSRNLSDTSTSNIIGITLSFITIIAYMAIFAVIYYKIFSTPSIVLDSDAYKEVYGSLYEDFKTTHAIYKWFIVAEKIRRTIFVVIIVTLTDNPESQIYSLVTLQTVWVIIEVLVRPKLTREANLLMIGLDSIILISFWLLATLINPDASNEYRVGIAWTVFALLAGMIGLFSLFVLAASLVSLTFLVISSVKKLSRVIKRRKISTQTNLTNTQEDSVRKTVDQRPLYSFEAPEIDVTDCQPKSRPQTVLDPQQVENKELFKKVENVFRKFDLKS